MKPQELINKFHTSNLKVKGGTFDIWGTAFGKRGDNFYCIEEIRFDNTTKSLELKTDYVTCTILNPSDISEIPPKNEFWPPILEIKHANLIRLEYTFKQQLLFIEFDWINKTINSNSKWYKSGTISNENKEALSFG
jgi:hypothetical protein